MIRILLFSFILIPFITFSQGLSSGSNINITKTWSQETNGWTYPIDINVPSGTVPDGGFPVCILLHGNGGSGTSIINEFQSILDCHALVAPTGYMNSWNICNEASDAPDIEMIEELANNLQTYSNINPSKIRIIGVSNGAALANSAFIQNTNTGIDAVCAVISQLSDIQYHAGDFQYPSGETSTSSAFCGYDTSTSPITGRKYLSICNDNDSTIPYAGGPSSIGINFIPAEPAARLVALSQGYSGPIIVPTTQIGSSTVYEASYLSGQVVLLKGDAGHGTNETQKDYLSTFLDNCNGGTTTIYGCTDPNAINYNPNADTDDGTCSYSSGDVLTDNTVINITKTWSQEPSGWTYPIDISVPTGTPPAGGFPLCVVLHGNGGNGGGTVNAWKNQISSHIIVGPSGYATSWNISDESSEAPDVEMVEELVNQLQTYSNVNSDKIRILGTSNGAALANRVFIENTNPGIDIICAIVSHLSEAQYHNGNFYYPSGDTGGTDPYDGYDIMTTPITGRKYLNISNNNDGLIPYTGGPVLGVNFLDAQLAAFIVAQSQGYTGTQLTGTGTQIGTSASYEFSYLNGQVVHLNGDAGHSTNTTQKDYVTAFFDAEDLTTTLYVDHTATGANDGSSWANAFTDLQDALAVGADSDIFVAEGTYYPTSGTGRGIAFEIPNAAKIYGGYPNGGGLADPSSHETILSGNIDNVSSYAGNSYHVVTVKNVDDIVLNGISIRDGNADDGNTFGRARGGGLFVNNATLTLNNTTVKWNKGIYGAGMFATLSDNVTLNESSFKNNTGDYGSAIYHSNETNLYIIKSKITNNNSLVRVAIEVNNSLFTRIENSLIANNASTNANAIGFISTNRDGLAEIINSTILGESANKNLITMQVGFGDELDLMIDNSIIAHQTESFFRAFKDYNNGVLNLVTNNCFIQGSSVIGTATNNLYSTTDGALMLNADYSLMPCSPGIDAGSNALVVGTTDINGADRILNSTVDMGAFETDAACRIAAPKKNINHDIFVFPNPVKEQLFIQTDLENLSFELYDLLGKKMLSTSNKELNIADFPQGIYMLRIMDNQELIDIVKIVKK